MNAAITLQKHAINSQHFLDECNEWTDPGACTPMRCYQENQVYCGSIECVFCVNETIFVERDWLLEGAAKLEVRSWGHGVDDLCGKTYGVTGRRGYAGRWGYAGRTTLTAIVCGKLYGNKILTASIRETMGKNTYGQYSTSLTPTLTPTLTFPPPPPNTNGPYKGT